MTGMQEGCLCSNWDNVTCRPSDLLFAGSWAKTNPREWEDCAVLRVFMHGVDHHAVLQIPGDKDAEDIAAPHTLVPWNDLRGASLMQVGVNH